MRKHLFVLTVVLSTILSLDAAAQTPVDVAALNQQIGIFYSQGKFDQAIPLAEKVLDNEKKTAKNSNTHALALMNLAMIHKERARALKKNIMGLEFHARRGPYAEAKESAEKARDAIRQVIEIFAMTKRSKSLENATATSELAWITYNFIDSKTTAETRAQIDEAEAMYRSAIAMRDELGAGDTDLAMKTILEFGDFYIRYVNFEKALEQYETYVAKVEKIYGPKSKGLVAGLRAIKEIHVITTRDDEAKAVADRIATITGTVENVHPSFPVLTLRSRKIDDVKQQGFVPIDFSDKPGSMFTYASSAGAFSQMGRAVLKSVAVNITVDEAGNVIEAEVQGESKFKTEVEAAAMASKFRPFNYRGTAQRMRGSIVFSYFER